MRILVVLIVFAFSDCCAQSKDSLVLAFGSKIESLLYENKGDEVCKLFDQELVFEHVLIHDLGDPKMKAFNDSFKSGIFSSFFNKIASEIQNGTYYDFFNFYENSDGSFYLVFRFFGESGLSYHEYLVVEEAGSYIINDVYIFISGEFFSQTMKRLYLMAIKDMVKGNEWTFDDTKTIKAFQKIQEAQEFYEDKKYEKAVQKFNEIDSSMINEKAVLLNGMLLCGEGQEDQYDKYYETYVKKYPKDISLFLLSIDYLMNKEDYDGSLTALDSLSSYTDDDFIDYMRGNVHYIKGDLENAAKHYKSVTKNYPTFLDAYDSLFVVYESQKKYPLAVEVLEELRSKFQFKKKEITKFVKEQYPELFESSAFNNWK